MSDMILERPAEEPFVAANATAAPPGEAVFGFSSALVAIMKPESPEAEAIRSLRSHLLTQHVNLGRRGLAICGASAHVGCSFTATNLAVSLSQVGVNTLLIDAAVRAPGLDRYIRPPKPPVGLVRRLQEEEAPFETFIDATPLPNLSLVYAGEASAQAQELLAGDRFRAFVTWCLREYDLTLIDTPPANRSGDARLAAAIAGAALLVSRKGWTFVRDLKTLNSQLVSDGVRVVGATMCGA